MCTKQWNRYCTLLLWYRNQIIFSAASLKSILLHPMAIFTPFKTPVSINSECLFCIGFLWLLSQFHQTKTKVLTELPLSRGCQEEPTPCLFQLQCVPALLSFWPHHTNCWLSAHTVFSPSVSSGLLLSLIGMHVIMFRAYPDNPGWSLKALHLITFAESFFAM